MASAKRLPVHLSTLSRPLLRSSPAVRPAISGPQRTLASVAPTSSTGDPEIPNFRYGTYPQVGGSQSAPVHHIRIPRFENLQAEREFRKLHQAAALRWLGINGYNNEGAGGHVTVRDPIMPDHFWINPHGKSFRYMRPEDLCLVDEQGVVKEGGNMHSINPAGYVIHSAVHAARPDVIAAVHCHSLPGRAFSALGRTLDPITQDSCRFYNDHALCTHHGGIAHDKSEGVAIAEALGEKKAVILANHGHLTVAKTVDGAAYLFGAMDRCMESQLMADAAAAGHGGQTVKVPGEVAEYSRSRYTDEMTYIMFQSCFEDVVRASNGELPFTVPGELQRV
jgi:ribulose-5-phosphate 4-epimerase/fuculose-1-phosphate aldolase